MTDEQNRRTSALAQPIGIRRRLFQGLSRRRPSRFEFDALAAYLGLLMGAGLGAASPAVVPVVANAAVQLCVAGALEVGRDGTAECLPP
jgi:hypothetical protein